MKSAPLPPEETARLAQLRSLDLLDTAPEPEFDDLTQLAAAICGTPMAFISLIDEKRQWFKSRVGMPLSETPREQSICAHTMLESRPVMVVADALRDDRFYDNPLVLEEPHIRFYAGAKLQMPDGTRLGTICVLDRVTRELDPVQTGALHALARQVVRLIELRKQAAELRRQENELREVLSLRHVLLDSAPVSIMATDRKGRIRTANPAACRLFGYREDELTGLPLVALHDTRELAQLAREVADEWGVPVEPGFAALVAKAEKGLAEEREWTCLRMDKSRFPAVVAITALHDAAGASTGFLAVAQDVTERKEVDRLKNEFVSTVSHELRTPLTSIRGALGLLEGGVLGALEAPALEVIQIARSNSDRLIRLINDILDLEKMEAGKLELTLVEVDPRELLTSALRGIQPVAEASGVTLRGNIEGEGQLTCDRDRLVQVLTNLVSNAIKFSPPNGVVRVQVEQRGAAWRFAVSDQGQGIAPHQMAKLFRKFQQLDASDTRSKGGTGLGLAITKAIVDQHRGRIWVTSEQGQGSVFLFELPARQRIRSGGISSLTSAVSAALALGSDEGSEPARE